MPSTARDAPATAGTSISPLDQLVNGNLPARKPRARRVFFRFGKRMTIMSEFSPERRGGAIDGGRADLELLLSLPLAPAGLAPPCPVPGAPCAPGAVCFPLW